MRRNNAKVMLAVAAVVAAGGLGAVSARADLITPAGLTPGTTFRFLYPTSSKASTTSLYDSTYDAWATTDATAAGYTTYNGSPVTWQALVSAENGNGTLVNACDRIPTSDVICRIDGTELASSTANFFSGTLLNPIGNGTPGTYAVDVWTGSNGNGTIDYNSSKGIYYTMGQGQVAFGDYTQTTNSWYMNDGGIADVNGGFTFAVYAFSNELTVPGAVPEPASLGLLGMAALATLRRRPRVA